MPSLSVVIPVGPFAANKRWLEEALESVWQQTQKPDDVLLIDDMAGLNQVRTRYALTIHRFPWRLGVAHAFNFGVALAAGDLIIMLGSDDMLEPEAVEKALETFKRHKERDAYYYFGLRYMDTGETQTTPCNAAAVTKGLWRMTGGFPVEAVVAPDAALISILMKHRPDLLYPIANGEALYNYRRHPETDTAQHGGWNAPAPSGINIGIRHLLTKDWKPPAWGRYE